MAAERWAARPPALRDSQTETPTETKETTLMSYIPAPIKPDSYYEQFDNERRDGLGFGHTVSSNPAWWEAAKADQCSHGGHGWDGETCSDADGVWVSPLAAAPGSDEPVADCACCRMPFAASGTLCPTCRRDGCVDHRTCPPSRHDFDPDGTHPDEQARDEQGRRRCNDCRALCFYCTADDQYHHAALEGEPVPEPCFLIRDRAWPVQHVPAAIPVPADWPGNECNRIGA